MRGCAGGLVKSQLPPLLQHRFPLSLVSSSSSGSTPSNFFQSVWFTIWTPTNKLSVDGDCDLEKLRVLIYSIGQRANLSLCLFLWETVSRSDLVGYFLEEKDLIITFFKRWTLCCFSYTNEKWYCVRCERVLRELHIQRAESPPTEASEESCDQNQETKRHFDNEIDHEIITRTI